MAYESDEEIKRAIALSLQESNAPRAQPAHTEVIDLDEDEEVEDEEARFERELQMAVEMSKKESTSSSAASQPKPTAPPVVQRPAGLGAITPEERRQMELERLERLKRTRPDLHKATSVVNLADDSDDEDADAEERARGAKRQHMSRPSPPRARRANTHASASSSATPRASAAPAGPSGRTSSSSSSARPPPAAQPSVFWDGELRQTGNRHVDPRKSTQPDFRLTDIIAPNEDIEFAILSAYCWQFPWVYRMFKPSTPVIAVDHSPTGESSIKAILPNWIRTTPFLRGGWGCMHMKFMLLFYRTGRLRVVITTANFLDYDWRDIENTVWVQDIPKRPAPADLPPPDPHHDDFPSALLRVLHAVNVAPALINHLRNDHPNLPLQRLEDIRTHWDFSKVRVALIPSVAGKHEGWPKVILTGHTCLLKSLIDIGGATPEDKELVLECQGSSVGKYSSQWLNEFHHSARGLRTWLDVPKARRAKAPLPGIKILFPTAQYVRESRLGEAGGGTMWCRREQWEGANFPRQLFHQTRSKRGPVLMHSKMVLGTFRDKRGTLDSTRNGRAGDSDGGDDEDKLVGWLYVGSHNFTPSAWGTLSGTSFSPSLNVNNYELGILIPLRTQEEVERMTCWERPPKKYVLGQDEPWIQSESPAFVEDG